MTHNAASERTWTDAPILSHRPAIPGQPPHAIGDGAAYNPATNTWRKLAPSPLNGRVGHTAVWTGSRMIVWGGEYTDRPPVHPAGAAYDPVADRWEALPEAPFPARQWPAAVWTGDRMLIFGGVITRGDSMMEYDDGAAYEPATRRWTVLPPVPLERRNYHRMVWTGTDVVIWGGYRLSDPNNVYDDGASFRPTG